MDRIRLGDLRSFAIAAGLGEGRLADLLGHLALDVTKVYLLCLGTDGEVRLANQTFARRLNFCASELAGSPIWPLLTSTDAETLRLSILAPARLRTDDLIVLNFVDSDQNPFTLRCWLLSNGDAAILAGEELVEPHASQAELLQLNNEMAVLSRENARKSRELSAALAELKKTQAMLVHSEKMASLGQMTAGLAHEINNPLAYVFSNQETLQRDFNDLLGLLELVDQAIGVLESANPELARRLAERAEEIDLIYLTEAIPRKIVSNLEGLERVRQLVLDLRTFSRIDEATWKQCDLEEGIRASLRFLQPLLRSCAILIETHFAPVGNLWCAPAALNQAVSNVVSNAIQASKPGDVVSVTTALVDAETVIDVEDRGCGMPPDVLRKVFDPFFTTKPPGAGTGLGLSIAHQIVREHQGRIEITSEVGQGTRLKIILPNQPRGPATQIDPA